MPAGRATSPRRSAASLVSRMARRRAPVPPDHEVGVEVGRRAGRQAAAQRPQVAGSSQLVHQRVQRRQVLGADASARVR